MTKQTMHTKREYSAGGVVFKRSGGREAGSEFKFLLGKHSGYHKWVLPKGRIEAGETAKETAVREVREEMGISARIVDEEPLKVEEYVFYADYNNDASPSKQSIDQPVRRVVKYQESGGRKVKVFKTVKWFLMEWVKGEPEDHDWEMEAGGWFPYEEALEKLSFEGEKNALTKAREKLANQA